MLVSRGTPAHPAVVAATENSTAAAGLLPIAQLDCTLQLAAIAESTQTVSLETVLRIPASIAALCTQQRQAASTMGNTLWATTAAASHVASSTLAESEAVRTNLTIVNFKAASSHRRRIPAAEAVLPNISQADILYEMSWSVVQPTVSEIINAEAVADVTLTTRSPMCLRKSSSPTVTATATLGVLQTLAAADTSERVSLIGDSNSQEHAIRSLLLSARQEHPGLAVHLPGK